MNMSLQQVVQLLLGVISNRLYSLLEVIKTSGSQMIVVDHCDCQCATSDASPDNTTA